MSDIRNPNAAELERGREVSIVERNKSVRILYRP